MASLKALSAFKASQLKYTAFLLGLPNTGTKVELGHMIRQRLAELRHPQQKRKVLSIDMGIKNLGVCVLESSPTSTVTSNSTPIRVLGWERVNVLKHLEDDAPNEAGTRANAQIRSRPAVDPAAFQPSNLSRTAVDLAQSLLATHNPDSILIERQRFRSGGASAVLEWTLRVNSLESMLWASFEAMRRESSKKTAFPEIFEVSPARVARFWCARPEGYETSVPESLLGDVPAPRPATASELRGSRSTVDKKQKIALVRRWLTDPDEGSTGAISLDFSNEAQVTMEAFLAGTGTSKRRLKPSEEIVGKLDDLADCLIQGVAWIQWAQNLERLRQLLGEIT